MDMRTLNENGEMLLGKRSSLINLWQEIAENFYPERADFTLSRNLGTQFADNLTTSYPVLVRRDLGNSLQSMLRPTEKTWFHLASSAEEKQDGEAKRWMEWAEKLQRKAMYDRRTQFTRATREGDHDFAAFGQCVLSVELNKNADGLLYRCWHLRDMAWEENEEGVIGFVYRKWKPTVNNLIRIFGTGKLHRETMKKAEKTPFADAEIRHMVVESDLVDGSFGTPFVSVFYDAEHQHVIDKRGIFNRYYVIPRWQTVSGSQYSFSPATVAGLPDARLLQAMTYTLLEAGEKTVNPPMVAVQEAIRSDVSLYAGGITWTDASYDGRLQDVLRPLTQDNGKVPLGVDMARDVRFMLAEAFYLSKLNLPQRAPEMTAYEVGQRIQQYIRDALPLFEPMEMEYNGALCEETFAVMMRAGAFGSPFDIPESVRGQDLTFKFQSPLHDAIEREKGAIFLEGQGFIMQAAQLDPPSLQIFDASAALREVLASIRMPAKWIRDEDVMKRMKAEADAQAQQQLQLAQLQQGAEAVKTLGEAGQAFTTEAGAGIV